MLEEGHELEKEYEVVLIDDVGRIFTRYYRTFSSQMESMLKATELTRKLDKTRFPDVNWESLSNPLFEETKRCQR